MKRGPLVVLRQALKLIHYPPQHLPVQPLLAANILIALVKSPALDSGAVNLQFEGRMYLCTT